VSHARRAGPAATRTLILGAVLGAGLALVAPPARAQSPTGSAEPVIAEADVSGARARGGEIVLRVDAVMPGGWSGLHLIEASLLVGGRAVETLRYDIEDALLWLGGREIVVGTGAEATGTWLGVGGSNVVVTTGGGHLVIRLRARVLRAIPADALVEVTVTGDRGEAASVRRGFAEPEPVDDGPAWGAVATAAAAALLLGAFVGNLFASRRRPPPRLSVYGAIQRRLDADRPGPP
jgi:hypothetical protein